jgi:hypothetical protein
VALRWLVSMLLAPCLLIVRRAACGVRRADCCIHVAARRLMHHVTWNWLLWGAGCRAHVTMHAHLAASWAVMVVAW